MKSSEFVTYYENADGTVTRRVSQFPVNYRDVSGTWQPIDTSLGRMADGRYVDRANSFAVSFAGGPVARGQAAGLVPRADRVTAAPAVSASPTGSPGASGAGELATVGIGSGESFGWSLAGASAVAPSVSGDTASYPGILPATTLALTSESYGVKESLILSSAAAGSSWTFPLSLTGVSLTRGSDGSWVLVDSAGTQVAYLQLPYAYDSKVDPNSGVPAETHDVSYALSTVGGVQELTMTLSSAWLSDPSRVFPVTVDPSVTVSIAGQTATTYVSTACTVNCNNSSSTLLQVGYDQTEIARSFFQFPSGSIADTGWHVTGAQYAGFLTHAWNTASSYMRYHVNPIAAPWTVNQNYHWTTSSNNLPPIGGSIDTGNYTEGSSTTCSIGGTSTSGNWTYTALDTTPFNSWSTNASAFYGLAVTGYSETDANYWKILASSQDSGCSPYVYLTYSPDTSPQIDSMSPASGTALSTLTPTLSATGSDPDSWPWGYVQYQFAVYPGGGGSPLKSSSWQTATSWTVPSGLLRWGQTYQWRVQAYDGDAATNGVGYSSVSYYTFTTAAPPPLLTDGLSQNTNGHGYSAAIGNYTTSATDARVATVGPALQITRDYNSLDPRTSQALGAGWSSLLDARATQVLDSSGNLLEVVITYPDGSQVPFGYNADGTYAPPLGRYATVTYASGSGYTLVDKDGTTYTFGFNTTKISVTPATFLITSVTDRLGRAVNFTYAQQSFALAGDPVINGVAVSALVEVPTTVTSAVSGRALHMAWSAPTGAYHPHVVTITTDPVTAGSPSTAQVWKYFYTGDELAEACDPINSGACNGSSTDVATRYTYQPGSQYASATLDSAPSSYWRFADSTCAHTMDDAVLANLDATAGQTNNVTCAVPGSPLAGSTATVASFDGSSSSVFLPSTSMVGATYLSISLWFKTSSAGPLWCEQSSTLDSTPANAVCSLYVGTDGLLYGGYYMSSNIGVASSTSVTDGKWHHAVLSGSATSESLYLDGKLAGSQSGTIDGLTMSNTYVGAGYNSTDWAAEPTTAGNWYFNGQISDVAYYTRGLTAVEAANLHAIGASSTTLLTKVSRPTGAVAAQVGYDGVSGRVTSVTDENGGSWTISPPAVTGSSQVFRSAMLGSAPASYYRLGEAAGASSAMNEVNSGSASYNNVTLGTGGVFPDETAAAFDGSTSYVTTAGPTVNTSGSYSVSAWVYLKSASGYQTVVAQIGNANCAFCLQYDQGDNRWSFAMSASDAAGAAAYRANSTSAPTLNTWTHLVGVFDASTGAMQLYVNGALQGTGTDPAPFATSGPTLIGRSMSAGTAVNYVDGSIGEVALWRSALDAQQVSSLYTAARNSTGIAPVETVTVTDPGNKTLTYRYDPENAYRLIASTDGLGHTTTYGYDTAGFLHTVTDPNGNVTTTAQDVRGNTVSKTTCQVTATATCSTEYWTYYPDDVTAILTTASGENDLPLTHSDARSSSAQDATYQTSYGYDQYGDRTSVTTPPVTGYPSGRTSTTAYTDGTSVLAYGSTSTYAPAGLPYKVTTPGGAVTTTLYYADGDLAQVIDPLGKSVTYTYDNLGRVATSTVGWSATYAGATTTASAATSYSYDADGRMSSQTGPVVTDAVSGYTHQKSTTYTYDNDGNAVKVVLSDNGTAQDASRTTVTTYNSFDQVQSVTDPVGNKTSYTYDTYGNKSSVTDPAANETDYSYDPNVHLLTKVLKNYTGDPVSPSAATNLTLESRAYDPAGRLASVTDAGGRTTSYTYTDNGLTASQTVSLGSNSTQTVRSQYDPAGNLLKQWTNAGSTETDYAYDAAGRVLTKTLDPSAVNRVATYTYTADDKINTETVTANGTSTTTTNGYDGNGNLLSTAISGDGATRTTTWTRDTRGLAETTTDAMSDITTYYHDSLGQLTETVAPAVNPTTFNTATLTASTVTGANPTTLTGYDTFGEKHETQNALGKVTTYTFDADGHTTAITGAPYTPQGSNAPITPTETKTYDGDGRLLTDTSPLNETTSYTYDQLGDTAKIVDGRGGVTHNTFDADRETLTSTSPAGKQTAASYDYLGRAQTTSVYEAARSQTETTRDTYGTGGWLAQTTSPAGVTTKYTYDALGEKLTSTDGAGNTTTYAYDGFGHIAKTLLADGSYTTASYNALGDVIATAAYDPTGAKKAGTSATYDKLGRQTATTNALGYTTTFGYYGPTNLVDSETQPVTSNTGITISIGYDLAGNRTSYTDGNANTTYWTWNSLGQQDTKTVPAAGIYTMAATRTTTYVYDADGQLTNETLPGGVTQTLGYDANGDLTSQSGTGAEATTATRCFSYDADGNMLTAATSTTSSTCASTATSETFTYDSKGDLLSGSGTAGTSTFTYTPDGLVNTRADAAGTATYTYDNDDRLNTLADPLTATTATYTYNTLGQPSTIAYGTGGDTRTFTYDALHRLTADVLTTQAGAQVGAIDYGYDAASQITSKTTYGIGTPSAGSSIVNTYTYDEAGRLTSWSDGTTSTGYGYDAASNRTSITATTISTATVTSNTTLQYDPRNELSATSDSVKSTSASYSYTARGTLANATAGTTSTANTFDAYGQNAAVGSTAYTYDALGRATAAGSSTLLYSGTGNQITSDNATALYSHDPDGQVVGVKSTGSGSATLAWTDQHQDLTARFTPTSTGLTAWTTYDPLGNTLTTSGTQIAIGYQSGYKNNGQINMAARWYSPATGQFTSADTTETSPVPDTAGANPYGYANASPLNGTDPTGHWSEVADAPGLGTYSEEEFEELSYLRSFGASGSYNDTGGSGAFTRIVAGSVAAGIAAGAILPFYMGSSGYGSGYGYGDPCAGRSGPACALRNGAWPHWPSSGSPGSRGGGSGGGGSNGSGGGAGGGASVSVPLLSPAEAEALSALGRTNVTFTVGTKPIDHANASTAPEGKPVTNDDNANQVGAGTGGFVRETPFGYHLDANGNYVRDADGTVFCGAGNTEGCVPTADPRHPEYDVLAAGDGPTLWYNLRPNDPLYAITPLTAAELKSVVGKFAYVVMPDGTLLATRLGGQHGHIDLARGLPVLAAGEIKLYYGYIKDLNNKSGHYQPSGPDARAAIEQALIDAGFDVGPNTYRESW